MISLKPTLNFNLNWLIIYLGVSSALVNPALAFAPILVGGMVTVFGFSTNNAVLITSIELVASSFSFIAALWWLSRVAWRKIAFISIAATSLGNFLSIGCDTFNELLFIRAITGFFEGNLLIIYMLVAAQVSNTEQLFGGKLALQMITAVVGLAVFPSVIAAWGMSGIYGVLTVATALLALGVYLLPNIDKTKFKPVIQKHQVKLTLWGALCLLLLLMFASGTNVVWTYLERIGTANALSLNHIGMILAGAILLSILCGFVSSSVGIRFGRLLPILIGLLAGIIGCLFLRTEQVTLNFFIIGVLLIAIAKVLPLPYLFGCLAVLDKRKQLTIFSHVVLSVGMASGPMVAVMLSQQKGYAIVLLFSIVMLSLTLMLAIKLINVVKRVESA